VALFLILGSLKSDACHLERFLSQWRPASLWGVELQQKGLSKGWDDVGGLNELRRSLLETLQWPSKVKYYVLPPPPTKF
jgi:hypothetical protein